MYIFSEQLIQVIMTIINFVIILKQWQCTEFNGGTKPITAIDLVH